MKRRGVLSQFKVLPSRKAEASPINTTFLAVFEDPVVAGGICNDGYVIASTVRVSCRPFYSGGRSEMEIDRPAVAVAWLCGLPTQFSDANVHDLLKTFTLKSWRVIRASNRSGRSMVKLVFGSEADRAMAMDTCFTLSSGPLAWTTNHPCSTCGSFSHGTADCQSQPRPRPLPRPQAGSSYAAVTSTPVQVVEAGRRDEEVQALRATLEETKAQYERSLAEMKEQYESQLRTLQEQFATFRAMQEAILSLRADTDILLEEADARAETEMVAASPRPKAPHRKPRASAQVMVMKRRSERLIGAEQTASQATAQA